MTEPKHLPHLDALGIEKNPVAIKTVSLSESSPVSSRAARKISITNTAAYTWLDVQRNLEYYQTVAAQNLATNIELPQTKDALEEVKTE